MDISSFKRHGLIHGLFLALFAVPYLHAVEITGTMNTALDYSDNVALVSHNKEADTEHTIGFAATVEEQRKNFQASANFRAQHRYYLNDTFDDETSITSGFGLINLGFVESLLDWRTSFTRTQVLNDAAADDTPNNREYRNVVQTGPVIRYQISPTLGVNLSSSYTSVENSDEDVSDSESMDGNLGLSYLYNPRTSFSLDLSHREIIDGDELEEYADSRVTVGAVRQLVRGQAGAQLGRTRLKPEASNEVESNFVSLSLSQTDIFWHDLLLEYTQNITDTSIGFTSFVDEQGVRQDLPEGISRNDIVSRKRVNATVARDLVDYGYEFGAMWQNESFEQANLKEQMRELRVALNQNIQQGLRATYAYRFRESDFGRVDTGIDRLSVYSAGLNKTLTQDVSVDGRIQFSHRRNSERASREYEALSIRIALNWTLF